MYGAEWDEVWGLSRKSLPSVEDPTAGYYLGSSQTPAKDCVLGLKPALIVSRKDADLVANGLFQTFASSALNHFSCLLS